MGFSVTQQVEGVEWPSANRNLTFEAFVDAKVVASFLGGRFHYKSIQRMAREGRIPAHAAGHQRKKWLFLLSEIQVWIKNGGAIWTNEQ